MFLLLRVFHIKSTSPFSRVRDLQSVGNISLTVLLLLSSFDVIRPDDIVFAARGRRTLWARDQQLAHTWHLISLCVSIKRHVQVGLFLGFQILVSSDVESWVVD